MARVLIVGAGIAGSFAAHALRAAGHDVVLVDKGFAPGGRVATRSIDGRTFDHGAQFLTAKTRRFQAVVDRWCATGIARSWFHGSPDADRPGDPDGFPRYRGTPTMRSIAEHLTAGLDVRTGVVVDAVGVESGRAAATLSGRDHVDAGGGVRSEQLEADALLLTAPIPQTLAMLDAGDLALDPGDRDALEAIVYDRCLAVLGVPRTATALPARGAVRMPGAEVEWITDHLVSGASSRPAVTLHLGPDASRRCWDDDDEQVGRHAITNAADALGTDVEVLYVQRWRYSAPRGVSPAESLLDRRTGIPIAIAGDALAGGRIEGAARSGWHAADALIAALAH